MRKTLSRQASAPIPTRLGVFEMVAFAASPDDLMPHVAFVSENFDPTRGPVPVRIHSECLTGDLFGSRRCDCGEQLATAIRMVAETGGVLVYLRQEGRGIGLINKLRAYNLQDAGLNTADANTHLGFEVDARQYGAAVAILADLGIADINLITNNPEKVAALERSGIRVSARTPLVIAPNSDNRDYLLAKKELMGHFL